MKRLHLSFYIAALAYLCSFTLNLLGMFGVHFDIGDLTSAFFVAKIIPLFMLIIVSPRRMPMRKLINTYLLWNVLIFAINIAFPEEISSNNLLNFYCKLALDGILWIVLFRIFQLSQRFSFVWWSAVSFLFVEVALSCLTIIRIFVVDISTIGFFSYHEYLSTTLTIECIPPILLCLSVAQFYRKINN